MSMAAMCDIRVAASSAKFAKPEIDRAWWPRAHQLTAQPARRQVREMIYTAASSAPRNCVIRFLDYIVEPKQVLPKAMEIAALIAKKACPRSRPTRSATTPSKACPGRKATS